MDAQAAAAKADELINAEIARQDKMWGVSNDRADASSGQLLRAALAQGAAIDRVNNGQDREAAFTDARSEFYPVEWSGFRDYGSDPANLAVMAAYVRQEIKRRIAAGESIERTSRDPATQPYTGDQPAEYTR